MPWLLFLIPHLKYRSCAEANFGSRMKRRKYYCHRGINRQVGNQNTVLVFEWLIVSCVRFNRSIYLCCYNHRHHTSSWIMVIILLSIYGGCVRRGRRCHRHRHCCGIIDFAVVAVNSYWKEASITIRNIHFDLCHRRCHRLFPLSTRDFSDSPV